MDVVAINGELEKQDEYLPLSTPQYPCEATPYRAVIVDDL